MTFKGNIEIGSHKTDGHLIQVLLILYHEGKLKLRLHNLCLNTQNRYIFKKKSILHLVCYHLDVSKYQKLIPKKCDNIMCLNTQNRYIFKKKSI